MLFLFTKFIDLIDDFSIDEYFTQKKLAEVSIHLKTDSSSILQKVNDQLFSNIYEIKIAEK
jgi:hypothetical protein